jgi:hypothetical protein
MNEYYQGIQSQNMDVVVAAVEGFRKLLSVGASLMWAFQRAAFRDGLVLTW